MAAPDTIKLADKIARLLEGESHPPQTAVLLAAIEKINHRLDKLEATAKDHAHVSRMTLRHPSLDKFSIAEAVSSDGSAKKDQSCEFEPAKPCDHCSMCNSRGF